MAMRREAPRLDCSCFHARGNYTIALACTDALQKESDLLQEKILALQAEQAARVGVLDQLARQHQC